MDALEVMQRYIAAIRSGDHAAAFAFYADDVVMHFPGRNPLAGRHEGRDAVVACLEAALARGPVGLEVEVTDMCVGDEHVALVLRERLRAEHGELDIRRTN